MSSRRRGEIVIPRIDRDTTVLGGCEDDAFREPSRLLFAAVERGEFTLVLSELEIRTPWEVVSH
jgi:hypothetical protein